MKLVATSSKPPEQDETSRSPFPFPTDIAKVDPSTLRTFLAFHRVINAFHQLMLKDLSEGGSQPSQMACLRLIAGNDGMCQRDIADAMRISRARVTNIVQSLEKAGAVRRSRDGADQRLTRVFLTDIGRSMDQEKGAIRDARINSVFGGMAENDRSELERHLDGLTLRIESQLQSSGPR